MMDILRAILDGVAIAAIFNGAVASLALINPRWFLDSYPKAIQKATPLPMTTQEKKINLIFICCRSLIATLVCGSRVRCWCFISPHCPRWCDPSMRMLAFIVPLSHASVDAPLVFQSRNRNDKNTVFFLL